MESQQLTLERINTLLINAKAEIEAFFAKEAELTEKAARLKELNVFLNKDQKNKTLLDDMPDEDTSKNEKQRDWERYYYQFFLS